MDQDYIIYTDLGNKVVYNPVSYSKFIACVSSYLLHECTKEWLAEQLEISTKDIDEIEQVKEYKAYFWNPGDEPYSQEERLAFEKLLGDIEIDLEKEGE